jgi:hypothetical protein
MGPLNSEHVYASNRSDSPSNIPDRDAMVEGKTINDSLMTATTETTV